MKKKLINISLIVLLTGTIGVILANNKAKIDKAAKKVETKSIVPVGVHVAKLDTFSTAFQIAGTVFPAREVKVASEVQGKLVQLLIDNGQVVSQGQVLAVLDAAVLNAQLRSIETSLAKTRIDINRFERLVELGGASSSQLENAILQQASLIAQRKEVLQQMEHMKIRAPFSGRIENVKVEQGSFVSFGTVLADLIDISSVSVHAYLSEKQAYLVNNGNPAQVKHPVLNTNINARIATISSKADPSGKYLAEVTVQNRDSALLRPGMIADVIFSNGKIIEGIAIPVQALSGSANQGKVFVVQQGKSYVRKVRMGLHTSERIQIIEGLNEGDSVVVSGQINLEDGSSVEIN